MSFFDRLILTYKQEYPCDIPCISSLICRGKGCLCRTCSRHGMCREYNQIDTVDVIKCCINCRRFFSCDNVCDHIARQELTL
jgi:hypothetical protein